MEIFLHHLITHLHTFSIYHFFNNNNVHSQSSYNNFIQMNFNKRQNHSSPLFSCQHFTPDNLSNAYPFSRCNFNPPNPTDICSGKFPNQFFLSLILFFPFPQQNTNYLTLLVSVNSVFSENESKR